jgi:hypothetical protein
VTCIDTKGRELSFRDITGKDLEYLDMIFGSEETVMQGSQIIELLEHLCTKPYDMSRLTPHTIRQVFSQLKEHILCNYMDKETWLKQCYSIQNGSFQNVSQMELEPMSKFTAMCSIHKEAMDQLGKDNDNNQI